MGIIYICKFLDLCPGSVGIKNSSPATPARRSKSTWHYRIRVSVERAALELRVFITSMSMDNIVIWWVAGLRMRLKMSQTYIRGFGTTQISCAMNSPFVPKSVCMWKWLRCYFLTKKDATFSRTHVFHRCVLSVVMSRLISFFTVDKKTAALSPKMYTVNSVGF